VKSSVDTGNGMTILFHALEHLKKQTPRTPLVNTDDMELLCDVIVQLGGSPTIGTARLSLEKRENSQNRKCNEGMVA
jgi:hypothetical protein